MESEDHACHPILQVLALSTFFRDPFGKLRHSVKPPNSPALRSIELKIANARVHSEIALRTSTHRRQTVGADGRPSDRQVGLSTCEKKVSTAKLRFEHLHRHLCD